VIGDKEGHGIPYDFRQRMAFYLPGWRYYVAAGRREHRSCRASVWRLFDANGRNAPVLTMDPTLETRGLASLTLRRNPHYQVNPRTDPLEAWHWHRIMRDCVGPAPDPAEARRRLSGHIERNRLRDYDKCYVFATGPSLARAVERDWSDGARVVCNTIVRDKMLWSHIRPHFIVAADAAYHFGFTAHAKAFRADLNARLGETETLFLYPAEFHSLCWREFRERRARLVPVPETSHKDLDNDLLRRFEFPGLGNVIARLLVVASTVSDNIFLWGFDGRGPKDKLFWQNSDKHSYPELIDGLKTAYPAFFSHYLPRDDKQAYIRNYFGDELDERLTAAEHHGKKFVMMHKSWTPTLQKRYEGA